MNEGKDRREGRKGLEGGKERKERAKCSFFSQAAGQATVSSRKAAKNHIFVFAKESICY